MEYQKPPLTYDEQLNLLISRGLKVDNRPAAINYLTNISYYRLSAYYLPFKQSEHFKPGTRFEDIIKLYTFDRKLRLLILDAIERIEIALRSQIIYHLSHTYGAFGYLDAKNFSHRFSHENWLTHLNQLIQEATETFIVHYKSKYMLSAHMPLWMVLEVVSFGGLSRLFRGLLGIDQQSISKQYGLPDTVLTSWLHMLVYIRNLCAHHARLWNRTLTFKPKLPEKMEDWKNISNTRVYSVLAMMQYLLRKIDPQSTWKQRLLVLLQEYSHISLVVMGFPNDWEKSSIWV